MESTRRDPLTGALNHGAIVAALVDAVDVARDDGRPVGIALIDIDNLTLLNDNHGHAAGDAALLAVADLLSEAVAEPMTMGRYGPDEFLVIAPPTAIAFLEPLVAQIRTQLVDLSLWFEETERLAGDGQRRDRGPARSTPRRRRRCCRSRPASSRRPRPVAGTWSASPRRPAPTTRALVASFDVLQGLIIAVDTKDRYTKRHSEDVARYAAFLAERIGLPAEEIRTIRLAGMLHDVGKVGIPDHILRKPGKLTEKEYDIVKQHVALGDLIVRDVPDLDQVRAGIRHHHERWDGAGYLHGLAGEIDPPDRADPRRRRCVLGDDDDPAVSQGPRHPRGARPARGCRREPARRAARDRVRGRHRACRGAATPR